jgi:HlyD family secretion protein
VVAYTTVLAVANKDLLLKPGMTATALITVAHKSNVLLVPNAALRFNPKAPTTQARIQIGARQNNTGSQGADFGRGARRQIWVQGAKGKLSALSVTTGDTDGTLTEVSGPGVQPGLKVVTGQLTVAAAK